MDNNKEKNPFILIRPIVYFIEADLDEKGSILLWLSLLFFVTSLTYIAYVKFGTISMLMMLATAFFFIGLLLKFISI